MREDLHYVMDLDLFARLLLESGPESIVETPATLALFRTSQALAAISRLVRDETLYTALAEAEDQEALFALLTNVIDRDAA